MTGFSPKTNALLRGLFAVDENGQTYIRVTEGEPQGELANAVNQHSNRSLETLLGGCIVLDDSGNPALRLAQVGFSGTVEARDRKNREDSVKLNQRRAAEIARVQAELNAGDPGVEEE